MKFYVCTLFPEWIRQAAATSILGRAAAKGYIEVNALDIRDFSTNKHNRVDDYPYGGGAGMVMEAEPVYQCVEQARKSGAGQARVVYLTPQGRTLDQVMVEELALEDHLILLCGHYEGIDERVLEEVVTDYISIGDYVLTGGELGAMVLIDAISRFVPGVLGNAESARYESMHDHLLEHPQYTRPEIWRGKAVPSVLLSGAHVPISEWQRQEALKRTSERRPDLLEKRKKLTLVFCGEASAEAAGEYAELLTRYADHMDLGRRKLRRKQHTFSQKDLLLIYMEDRWTEELRQTLLEESSALSGSEDGEAGQNGAGSETAETGRSVPEQPSEEFLCWQRVLRQIRGSDTAVLLLTREGLLSSLETAQLEKQLEEQGFSVWLTENLQESLSETEKKRLALRMRRVI